MSDQSKESQIDSLSAVWQKRMTRRTFLEGFSKTTAGGIIANVLLPTDSLRKKIVAGFPDSERIRLFPDIIEPRNIHGVEVLGLSADSTSSIKTEEDARGVTRFLLERFTDQLVEKVRHDPQIDTNRAEEIIHGGFDRQREYFLDPNSRYLQVIVRELVFRSFEQRRKETGVEDFVEWYQMHVDMFNRLVESSKPSSPARIKLRRVVVVSDSFDDTPSGFRPQIDSDGNRFEKEDYRPRSRDDFRPYFWSVDSEEPKGDLILSWPAKEKAKKAVRFPYRPDSLAGRNNVEIDLGLVEEIAHIGWSLPDRYTMNVEGISGVPNFNLEPLGGPFSSPENISPYDLMKLEELRKKGRKVVDREGAGVFGEVFGEVPKRIELTVKDSRGVRRLKVFRLQPDPDSLKTEEDYHWVQYKPKVFIEPPLEINGSTVRFDQLVKPIDLEEGHRYYPTNFVIEWETENGSFGTLHLPVALFNMSCWSGQDSAVYKILVTGRDDSKEKTQALRMVEKSQAKQVLKKKPVNGYRPYAVARIDGTSIYSLWYLR